MWQSRILTVVLIGLVAVLTIHILNQTLEGARADLTADDLYSLTPGTQEILDRMQREGVEPVDIRLYFSETVGKTLPKFIKDFITYERYLRSLLKEYERAAGGKIRVHLIDPAPDSDEAQDAVDYGLDGKPINQHGDLFFFGLVLQSQTGSTDVVEFLWPDRQESIEYEISKKLYSLLWPKGKRIGVLSSLEVFGTAKNPYMAQMLAAQGKSPRDKWMSLQLLEEPYEVREIDVATDQLSREDYDLVVVIHPKNLPGKTLWALDEWVVRGGKTLVFLDPYSIEDQAPRNPQQPWAALQYRPSSALDPLLEAWGLSLPQDTFAADLDLAVKRPVAPRGPAESVVVDLAIDDATREATLATSHPIFQGLGQVRLFMAGSLEQSADASAAMTPLITTTPGGSTLAIQPGFGTDSEIHYTDLGNPARLRDRFSPGSEPVVMAYLLTGELASAYPDGAEFPSKEAERPPGLPTDIQLPPPEDAEIIRKEPVPEEERATATVLVFADVDFISDQIAFQRNFLGLITAPNDNHKVLLNSVDFLLGAQELMNVRAKHSIRRPFTLFDEIEAVAEKETLERERQIRQDIAQFEQELQEKQREITGQNVALFQKRLQEDVDRVNDKLQDRNRELREIRKSRRAALEREEAKVRFAVMGWMPTVVLAAGILLSVRRYRMAKRS